MDKICELLDLNATIAAELFARKDYPWEVLDGISGFVVALGQSLPEKEYTQIKPAVWVAKDAVIAESAFLGAPCIVDHRAEIRHCAYIREAAIIGKCAVIGNSVEVKNAIIFDGAQIPHFNYVGDSIIGKAAHMGAGAVTSNIKSDETEIVIRAEGTELHTGRIKIGAVLGDHAEIGCNTVLNPGTVIGRGTRVYPGSVVRGYVPSNRVYKAENNIVPIE